MVRNLKMVDQELKFYDHKIIIKGYIGTSTLAFQYTDLLLFSSSLTYNYWFRSRFTFTPRQHLSQSHLRCPSPAAGRLLRRPLSRAPLLTVEPLDASSAP